MLVIPADDLQPMRLETIDNRDVDAFRHLVGGGLQAVNLSEPDGSVYINDEGKLNGLEINRRLTMVTWIHNQAFLGRDGIVGDGFLVGKVDPRGDDTSVTDEMKQRLMEPSLFRLQVKTIDDPKWYGNSLFYTDWVSAYLSAIRLHESWALCDGVKVLRTEDGQ